MAASKSFCTHCGANVIRIGRGPDNDVVLDYRMISDHHARITTLGDAAIIEDLGSSNGTAIGSPDKKIVSGRLSKNDTVYFGSFPIPASRLLAGSISLGKKPHTLLDFTGQSMLLGRAPDCDVVLNHPMVAYHHARISRADSGYIVEDLGLTTGTFVNGQAISGSVPISVGDVIRIGSYSFDFSAPNVIKQRDYRGNVTLEARGVTVAVSRGRKRLVEDAWLTIYPSEIVALMGPAGAGKTTLMNALNGYTRPTSGTVLINGQALYANYDQFCGHIGYMPQDDIMHRELTVGQALYYTARLRLPSDHSKADIKARIKSILKLLDIEAAEDVIIGSPEKKGISGGQRKRVNLAMELMTDPSILFLDEPTSGLSSEDALGVMKMLRDLADAGKTILITIHQPGLEVFRMADTLLMVSKDKGSQEAAKVVYFGPAYPDAVEFFNPNGVAKAKLGVDPSPDEIMRGLSKGKTEEWVRRYSSSEHKRRYVDERLGKRPSGSAQPVAPKMKREAGLSQWWTLVKRNLAIKLKDRWNTAFLLALAPVIGYAIVLTMGIDASKEKVGPEYAAPFLKTTYTIFFLMVSAIFFGCWSALREIVGEWAVYRRERMVNLKIPSYVASKFTVLGGLLGLVQCPILFAIVYNSAGLKGPWLAMLLVLILTAIVALAIGLIISAVVRTSETATSVSVLIMILMILMAGAIVQSHHEGQSARPITHFIASRWAFEGLLLLESDERGEWEVPTLSVPVGPTGDDLQPQRANATKTNMAEKFFPKKERFGTPTSVMILFAMLAALVAGIMWTLKTRDIH
jgi:ABC transport system ATP-binding/permease protein